MTIHTFQMSEEQAERIHQLASSHIQALKNWIAGRVETGDLEGAQKLVKELRHHESIFASFNMKAKHEIAKWSDKPLEIEHFVQETRR